VCAGRGNCTKQRAYLATRNTIDREQFPVGFATEDVGLGAFTARFEVFCVHPDSSGEYAWICTEIMDLDAAAKMPKE